MHALRMVVVTLAEIRGRRLGRRHPARKILECLRPRLRRPLLCGVRRVDGGAGQHVACAVRRWAAAGGADKRRVRLHFVPIRKRAVVIELT